MRSVLLLAPGCLAAFFAVSGCGDSDSGSSCTPEWVDTSECDCQPEPCKGCTGTKQQDDGCEHTQQVECSRPPSGCSRDCCGEVCCTGVQTCQNGTCCTPNWVDSGQCQCTPTACGGCSGNKPQEDGCGSSRDVPCTLPPTGCNQKQNDGASCNNLDECLSSQCETTTLYGKVCLKSCQTINSTSECPPSEICLDFGNTGVYLFCWPTCGMVYDSNCISRNSALVGCDQGACSLGT